MKAISIPVFFLCITLCGCTTSLVSQSTSGMDFDESKISHIKKGLTTADQVVALFGEPESKEIVSPTQVLWHYDYRTISKTDTGNPFVSDVEETTGYEKKLDLLMQNDVVLNFSYVQAPIHSQKVTPL